MDLSNAAFFACSNLVDTGDGAGNDLIKPAPATRDRSDQRGAGLGAYGSKLVSRPEVRSLVPGETAIALILASSLWAPQTRSWRQPAPHVRDRSSCPHQAQIKSTNQASRIGGSTREEHRA